MLPKKQRGGTELPKKQEEQEKTFVFQESGFYKGDDWTDYIASGGITEPLYESLVNVRQDGSPRAWLFLTKPPTGSLLVTNGIDSISAMGKTWNAVSNTDVPQVAYWKKGSVFSVITADYNEEKVIRTNYKLYPLSNVLENKGGLQALALAGAERLVSFLNSLGVPVSSFDSIGIWVQSSETIGPMFPSEYNPNWLKELLDEEDNTQTAKSKGALLPLALVAGGLFTGFFPLSIAGGLLLFKGKK